MTALIIATVKVIGGLSLTTILVGLTACGVWRLVYYGCGCRKNPIGKTAMLTAAILWIVSAAIINLA